MTDPPAHVSRRRPGRPRRSVEQEAEIRTRVTEIAAQIFRDEGLEGLSMRRIAREAGVSPMSLYDYFTSRNEIIRSIWERFFARCFARLERAVKQCRSGPRARLEAGCGAYVRYWLDHPDEYRAVFMIEDKIEKQERYFVETSSIMNRYRIFADLLSAQDPDLASNPEALRQRTLALVCALNGVCHMLVTVSEYPWPPPARILEHILRIADT